MGVIFLILAVILLGYALYYVFLTAMAFYGIMLVLIPGSVCLFCLYVGYRNPKNFGLLSFLAIFVVLFLKVYYPWATHKIGNLGYLSKPFLSSGETILIGCEGMGHCQDFTSKYWRSEAEAQEACRRSYNGNGGKLLRACDIADLSGYCAYGPLHHRNPQIQKNLRSNFEKRYQLHYKLGSKDLEQKECKRKGGKWGDG